MARAVEVEENSGDSKRQSSVRELESRDQSAV